jgi:hypothetical protein
MPAALNILIPVWGAYYCHTLTTFLLPSLLAPGNLPAWPWRQQTTLQLLTTAQDAEILSKNGILTQFEPYCQVDFAIFDPIMLKLNGAYQEHASKYHVMSVVLSQAFQMAAQASADVIPLMADMILSDGFFHYLVDVQARGMVLLLHPSPRVQSEGMGSALHQWRTGFQLSVPAGTLARETIRHLHPHEQACFLDAPEFTHWPSHFYIPEPGGVYAHCLHMHPMYMYQPRPLPPGQITTIDVGFIHPYADRYAHIEVASNRYFSACSLSNPQDDFQIQSPELINHPLSRFDLIRKLLSHSHPIHQHLFWQGVYYDLTPP